jgi:hypothetical protein
MGTRRFSAGEGPAVLRTIDNDAPNGLRQEILEVAFSIAENATGMQTTPERIQRIVSQTLGIAPSGNPWAGYRHAAGRDLDRAPWERAYDVILRLAAEFDHVGRFDEFREGVNQALAGYGVVWDLSDDRRLTRVVPSTVQAQIVAVFQELSASRFAPAMQLLVAARDAYDDRPRRDRDACSNAFDALESVAKEKQQMPQATFGRVISQMRAHNSQVLGVLSSINTLRNRNFGHGMTAQFSLTGPEVDFTYSSCLAGILLFARMT